MEITRQQFLVVKFSQREFAVLRGFNVVGVCGELNLREMSLVHGSTIVDDSPESVLLQIALEGDPTSEEVRTLSMALEGDLERCLLLLGYGVAGLKFPTSESSCAGEWVQRTLRALEDLSSEERASVEASREKGGS